MGDFNRERRFFRISEVIGFATTSIEKYEALFSNKEDEFEDYVQGQKKLKDGTVIKMPAEFFAIKMNGDDQNALVVDMTKDKDGNWKEPLGYS